MSNETAVNYAASLLSKYSSADSIAEVMKSLTPDQMRAFFAARPEVYEKYLEGARASANRSY